MREAVGEGRIEDHAHPGVRRETPRARFDIVGDRRLHPAIGRQDPEGGNQRADGDHQRGCEVQFRPHALQPEQHDAQEPGLQEKRGQDLIGQQGAEDRRGALCERPPIGAELIAHHDSGNDAHGERHGEDGQPELEDAQINVPLGVQPQAFQHGQIAGQPDGEGWEDDVERYRERELYSRQNDRIG